MYLNPTAGSLPAAINASAYDIAVYYGPNHPGTVTNANITGAKWYGVVADGAKVNVTGSKVHDIGARRSTALQKVVPSSTSMARAARSVATRSTTSRRTGSRSQPGRRWHRSLQRQTSATVEKNVVTGQGDINYIAQNGIVIRDGASAAVKNNTVSGFYYTPDGHRGHGPAELSE